MTTRVKLQIMNSQKAAIQLGALELIPRRVWDEIPFRYRTAFQLHTCENLVKDLAHQTICEHAFVVGEQICPSARLVSVEAGNENAVETLWYHVETQLVARVRGSFAEGDAILCSTGTFE